MTGMRLAGRLLAIAAAMHMVAGAAVAPAASAKDIVPAAELPVFVELKPLLLPLVDSHGRIIKHVYVHIGVEVASEKQANRLRPLMPRLRHALMRELYGVPLGQQDDPTRFDVGAIKARLLPVARHAIDDIPITAVVVTRIEPVTD